MRKLSQIFHRAAILSLFIIAWVFTLLLNNNVCAAETDGRIINRTPCGKFDGVNIDKIVYYSDNLKVNGLLFLPQAPSIKTPIPCVVFCHDGISGNSKEHRLSCIRLAKEGYAVFAPAYRGEDGSEGTIEIAKGEVNDVLNALAFLMNLPEIDKNRIALAGASHGALIAVLAASKTDKICAVVEAYGVMDIYKWWDYLKKNDMVGKDEITRRTYGGGPQDRPKSFAIRNAVSQIKTIKCPVLILQGEKDKIVPSRQAAYLSDALKKHAIPCQLKIFPNCDHGFLVYASFIEDPHENELEETEQAWRIMTAFLKQNFQK